MREGVQMAAVDQRPEAARSCRGGERRVGHGDDANPSASSRLESFLTRKRVLTTLTSKGTQNSFQGKGGLGKEFGHGVIFPGLKKMILIHKV